MSNQYTGHVEPGGPTARRVVETPQAHVEIRKLSVGPMDNNAYVLVDTGAGKALLIDAANDASRLLTEVDGLDLVAIVTTHGHRDHWQALGPVADATAAPVFLHPADQDLVPRPADKELIDGQVIGFGSAEVSVIHTPGHTPGSTCLLLGGRHLFTGDTLFPGGHGRVIDDEHHHLIMDGLEREVFDRLPDDTWVYPGHGDDTTLGAERPHLAEWRERGW